MPDSTVPALLEQLTAAIRTEERERLLDHAIAAVHASLGASNGHPAAPRRKRQAARSAKVRPSAQETLACIRANPGTRSEALTKALRTDAKTLRPVLHELIASKKVRTKGQRRGMTYEVR